MDKVTFIEIENAFTKELEEHAIIEHADGSFTSMHKATYEAQLAAQVEHLTEISTADE